MKLSLLTTLLYITSFTVAAPPSSSPRDVSIREASPLDPYNTLEKRKGGGGGRGSSGGSSGGSTGGSSGGRTGGYSNTGGRTAAGSGTRPAYGNRYIGGATVPYKAGGRTPTRGIGAVPFVAAGFLIFPGIWLYSTLYAYPYGYPYYWNSNGRNRTSNVTCVCQEYSVCGCDPDGDENVLRQMIGNGTDRPVNTSTVRTVDYGNGTVSSFINGTLENGTTAAGGTDDAEGAAALTRVGHYGYLVMVVTVVAGVMIV